MWCVPFLREAEGSVRKRGLGAACVFAYYLLLEGLLGATSVSGGPFIKPYRLKIVLSVTGGGGAMVCFKRIVVKIERTSKKKQFVPHQQTPARQGGVTL